jgi:hypothetical protein
VVYTAAELAPSKHALSYSFTKGIKPRARNQVAAMLCKAVVICGRTKYFHSVVHEFRARGRRVFWFNKNQIREIEVSDVISRSLHTLHGDGEGTPEWDLWAQQLREKRDKMDEIFTGEVGHVTKCNACSICGFRKTCESRMPEIKRFIKRDGVNPRGLDGVPTYGWSEPVNDVDCHPDDVLHPRHTPKPVDDFESRREEYHTKWNNEQNVKLYP